MINDCRYVLFIRYDDFSIIISLMCYARLSKLKNIWDGRVRQKKKKKKH